MNKSPFLTPRWKLESIAPLRTLSWVHLESSQVRTCQKKKKYIYSKHHQQSLKKKKKQSGEWIAGFSDPQQPRTPGSFCFGHCKPTQAIDLCLSQRLKVNLAKRSKQKLDGIKSISFRFCMQTWSPYIYIYISQEAHIVPPQPGPVQWSGSPKGIVPILPWGLSGPWSVWRGGWTIFQQQHFLKFLGFAYLYQAPKKATNQKSCDFSNGKITDSP